MTDTLNPETARAAFVNAMGAAVTGVHIVTTEGEAGPRLPPPLGGRGRRLPPGRASVMAHPPEVGDPG